MHVGLGTYAHSESLGDLLPKSTRLCFLFVKLNCINLSMHCGDTIFSLRVFFSVDCAGRKGGLVLLWNDPYDIKISSYSCGHIDCTVTHEQNVWRFTGFYGNPNSSSRTFSWKLLKSIPGLQHLPWLVGGDFNEILYESEKVGGSLRSLSQMSAFRDVINSCTLSDLNFTGEQFTWCNRR